MRALVTGAGGFVGRHLARHLAARGDETHLTGRSEVQDALRAEFPRSQVSELDVRSPGDWKRALEASRPEVIYHLAAITFVPDVERDPGGAHEVNVGGTVRLFEASAAARPAPRVVFVSTGHLYAPSREPIDESGPIESGSFYGITKRQAEEVARHFAARGVAAVIARPFNHSGPGQAPSFVLPSFARQIAEAEAGRRPPQLSVGNLSAVRDFLDVRDVVRAYRLLATHGAAGETYNVASGVGRSVREALDALLSKAKIPVTAAVDPSRLRAQDAHAIVGNAAKLTAATGWRPELPFETMIGDLLADARASLA